jgi:hypothetical protein
VATDYESIIQRVKELVGMNVDTSAHAFLGSTSPKMGTQMTLKQRIVEHAYRILTYPDPFVGWLKPALPIVKRLVRSGDYDALISTSYPYTAHLIASRAVAGTTLPWIADLRDAWRDNHYEISRIRSALNALLERKTLRRATCITTVSEPLARLMSANNPSTKAVAILNAFDPDEWVDIPFVRPAKFTLTYAGSLLQGFRDPEPLFDALLDEFQSATIDRKNVEINLYIRREEWVESAITSRRLEDVVTVKGYVDRPEVLKAERGTSANLLLLRDHPEESGVYTGKLFEYLGAGRPILALGGPERSVVRDLLERISGYYARTRAEARSALRKLYEAHMRGENINWDVACSEYSANAMAQKFASLLDQISAVRET